MTSAESRVFVNCDIFWPQRTNSMYYSSNLTKTVAIHMRMCFVFCVPESTYETAVSSHRRTISAFPFVGCAHTG